MPDESTKSITINAGAADVMAVIADFDSYPEWAGSIKTTEVLAAGADGRAERVRFAIDAVGELYIMSKSDGVIRAVVGAAIQ